MRFLQRRLFEIAQEQLVYKAVTRKHGFPKTILHSYPICERAHTPQDAGLLANSIQSHGESCKKF